MKTLDGLPPEIMHLILDPGHFTSPFLSSFDHPKKDYINLRLVSQTFSAIITPHIFKHLQIKSSECSLQRLETIAESQHLKKLVKKYSYTLSMGRLPPTRVFPTYPLPGIANTDGESQEPLTTNTSVLRLTPLALRTLAQSARARMSL